MVRLLVQNTLRLKRLFFFSVGPGYNDKANGTKNATLPTTQQPSSSITEPA